MNTNLRIFVFLVNTTRCSGQFDLETKRLCTKVEIENVPMDFSIEDGFPEEKESPIAVVVWYPLSVSDRVFIIYLSSLSHIPTLLLVSF